KNAGRIVEVGELLLSDYAVSDLKTKLVNDIEHHHKRDPLSRGISKETARERIFGKRPEIFQFIAAELERTGVISQDRDVLRLVSHRSEMSAGENKALQLLRDIYSVAGLEVLKLDDVLAVASAQSGLDKRAVRKVFQVLLDSGELIHISDEFYFESKLIDNLITKVRSFAEVSSDRAIDVPKFKEIAGISRKYAIPLLEYFDRQKITQRIGDKRTVMK
ncbi:MAG TPA: SelB C-terminal domain-containing protein, partial [Pyrinomonadaceae bacterium]|nr:SelB C-terminal domain-containing protein [Pyrinomonadaceae bacterium]